MCFKQICFLDSKKKIIPIFFSSFFAFLQKPPQTPWAGRRGEWNVLQTPNLHGNTQLIGRLLGYLLGDRFRFIDRHADVSLQWFWALFMVGWFFTVHWFRGVPREFLEEVDFLLIVFLVPPYSIIFGDFFLGGIGFGGSFSGYYGRILRPEKVVKIYKIKKYIKYLVQQVCPEKQNNF